MTAMRFPSILVLTLVFHLQAVMANEPADALENYFKALRMRDTNLLSTAIQAPDAYKEQFLRVIDVSERLQLLDDALAKKYEPAPDKRHNFSQYLGTLSLDLKALKIEINGDKARSLPSKPDEAPVSFVKVGDDWKLDLEKGQSNASLAKQAEYLKEVYDLIIPLLNGLLLKIDTLDTNKFTYDDAWKMVAIQLQRKIESVIAKQGERIQSP